MGKINGKLTVKDTRRKEKIFIVHCTLEDFLIMTVKAKNKKEAREKAEMGDYIDIDDDIHKPRFSAAGEVKEENQ